MAHWMTIRIDDAESRVWSPAEARERLQVALDVGLIDLDTATSLHALALSYFGEETGIGLHELTVRLDTRTERMRERS